MFQNTLSALFLSAVILMSASVTSSAATSNATKPTYVKYKDYNREVLPKIDQGYTVVKHDTYTGAKNRTKDTIISEAETLGANFVMVKSDFGFEEVSFDIYYLKKKKSTNSFGAETVKMPLYIRQNFNSNDGCTLGEITYGSAAYNADLHKDDVITKVDDLQVFSCKQFHKVIRHKKAVKLKVWADNKTYSIELKLQTK